MRYVVYQIQVDPLNPASMDAKAEAMIRGDAEPGLAADLYRKVAEIEASDLDEVFDIGNVGPEHKITRCLPMSSISVGDIIEAPGGERYVVAPLGFRLLGWRAW